MNKPIYTSYSHFIKDVGIFEFDAFTDQRGLNFEIYSLETHRVIDFPFYLDSCSVSKKGVLRGMHGDSLNWKLIQCLFGEIQLCLIDMREGYSTFGKTMTIILNAEKPTQVLVPAGVVNGHLCLSDNCVFFYKWSNSYVSIEKQIHVKWNDPRFKLPWLITNPITSERDK